MKGPISEQQVVKSILSGIVKAQKDHEAWSAEWLWEAPEYFATVYVASEIGKNLGSAYLTLESSAKKAMKDAGAQGRGKLHTAMRSNGRFDLLLWWANGSPRAPIEIKCQVLDFKKISADVARIEKVVTRNSANSTIGFGCSAFYASCKSDRTFTAKEKLEKSFVNIVTKAKASVGDKCRLKFEQSKVTVDGDSAWAVGVLTLKPRSDA